MDRVPASSGGRVWYALYVDCLAVLLNLFEEVEREGGGRDGEGVR